MRAEIESTTISDTVQPVEKDQPDMFTGGMSVSEAPAPWLSDLAAQVAAGDGDPHPWSAQYVHTTRRAALPVVHGGWMKDDQGVNLVMPRGNFVRLRGPRRAPPLRRTVVTFTADPVTHCIYDSGISDQVPDLSVLGQVHSLSLS